MLQHFIHNLTGIPAPLYLLGLLPFAWLYYMRRYRPNVKLSPPGWEMFEFGACWFFATLILLSLYIVSVIRVGLEHWPF